MSVEEDMDIRIQFGNPKLLGLVGASASDDFVDATIPAGQQEITITLQTNPNKPSLAESNSAVAQLQASATSITG